MIQNALKIATLGFFFSIITGFVMYRSGYFDSAKPSYALQTSPNGGDVNNANNANNANGTIDQDTNRTPKINQQNRQPIMPSSKSMTPAFDLEKYQREQSIFPETMPSSKSMAHPIRIMPSEPVIQLENPHLKESKLMMVPVEIDLEKHERQQLSKEQMMSSSKSARIFPDDIKLNLVRTDKQSKLDAEPEQKKVMASSSKSMVILEDEPKVNTIEQKDPYEDKPKGISWGLIGLGVLGIFFVGIGSIVYFKKRSK